MTKNAYSAKLVFQYLGHPKEHGRWLFEERIVTFEADGANQAYEKAVRIGKDNVAKCIRFLGVAGLIKHDPILDENEVWYELHTSKNPKRLVPPKRNVLKNL